MDIKRNSIRKIITFLIFVTVSAAIGYFIGRYGGHLIADVPKGVKLWLAILFIPSFFIVIGIHEAGHALAGVLLNFNFKMYVVGPFMWNKELKRWKFKWNKNVNTAGGMVICLPTGTENLAKRFSIYALGGPLASLVLVGVAFLLYKGVEFQPTDSGIIHGVAKYFFLLLFFFSFLIFIVTIIPFHMGGFSSDGARALRLLSGGEKSRFEVLLLKIIGSSTAGLRPGLLNKEELEEAELLGEKTSSPMALYIAGIQHQVEFDGGSMEKAEYYLIKYADNADKIPDGIRNSVWIDAAFFYAFGRKDLEKAMFFWSKFRPNAMLAKAQILAVEAAINVLKGDKALALEHIKASRAELPNMLDQGVALVLGDKLTELENRIAMIDPQISPLIP